MVLAHATEDKGEEGIQAVGKSRKEYQLLLAQLGAWMLIRRSAFLLVEARVCVCDVSVDLFSQGLSPR